MADRGQGGRPGRSRCRRRQPTPGHALAEGGQRQDVSLTLDHQANLGARPTPVTTGSVTAAVQSATMTPLLDRRPGGAHGREERCRQPRREHRDQSGPGLLSAGVTAVWLGVTIQEVPQRVA